jgi:hypothetical protein
MGRALDKHHFRALRELWVDDIWKAEGSAGVAPTAGDNGNGNEEESLDGGEVDEDENEDEEEEEEEQDDDEGAFEEQHGEDDLPQAGRAIDAVDQSDAESVSSWSSDD